MLKVSDLRIYSNAQAHIFFICTGMCVIVMAEVALRAIKSVMKAQMASTQRSMDQCAVFFKRACEMAYVAFGYSRKS